MQEITNIETDLFLRIKRLEDKGIIYQYQCKNILHDQGDDSRLFVDYMLWKIELLRLAEEIGNRDFEIAIKNPDGVDSLFTDIAIGQHISQGTVRMYYSVKDSDRLIPDKETIRQVKAMDSGINHCLEALSKLRNILNTKKNDDHIVLTVDQNKGIIFIELPKRKECAFRKVAGKNKRFDYFLKIVRKPKIGSDALIGGKHSIQTLSSQIFDLNQRLMKELGLSKKVVLNKNNTGYYIDDETYKIRII